VAAEAADARKRISRTDDPQREKKRLTYDLLAGILACKYTCQTWKISFKMTKTATAAPEGRRSAESTDLKMVQGTS
jgi:hypothetical protein